MQLNYIIPSGEAGWKLQDILLCRMNLSQTIIKKLKATQSIYVNSAQAFTNYIVCTGDSVLVMLDFEVPNPEIIPIDGKLDVLYEDQALLIVNKPSGMNVHPSQANYTGSLSNIVAYYYETINLGACIHSVNRLDRDTCGIVVFAKNAYIKDRLIQSMQRGEFEKKYLGWVMGNMSGECGTIDAPIRRSQEGSMIRIIAPDGNRAVTKYRTENVRTVLDDQERCTEISLIEFTLETGRTHQIRVHCLSRGCPLLGDKLYFTKESEAISKCLGIEGQALCAHKLKFPHPIRGEMVEIELKGAMT